MQNLRAAKAQRDDVFGSQFFLVPGTKLTLQEKRVCRPVRKVGSLLGPTGHGEWSDRIRSKHQVLIRFDLIFRVYGK